MSSEYEHEEGEEAELLGFDDLYTLECQACGYESLYTFIPDEFVCPDCRFCNE